MNKQLIRGKKLLVVTLASLSLASCASDGFLAKQFGYTPDKYVPIDKIQDHIQYTNIKTKKPEVAYQKIVASPNAVLSSTGKTTDPKQVQAFKNYIAGSGSYIINGDHMKIYPFDKYSTPTITCSLGMVCTITLEKGELMTGTNKIGTDPLWNITIAKTGQGEDKLQIISLKPKPLKDAKLDAVVGMKTNFVVPTNKRVYRFMLNISDDGSYEDVSFYYPNETIDMLNKQARSEYEDAVNEQNTSYGFSDDSTKLVMTDSDGNYIVNTDYSIKSDNDENPAWKPTTVWDNGQKTIVQMPKNISQLSLPNILVVKDTQDQEVITPRYRNGAFILDGIYKKLILFKVANDNKTKVQVTVTNNNYPS